MLTVEEVTELATAWGVRLADSIEEIRPGRVFRVQSGSVRLIIKSTQQSLQHLQFELEILDHLANSNAPVAVPLRAASGEQFVEYRDSLIVASPCLLAPGAPKALPFPTMLPEYGRSFALLHSALSVLDEESLRERTWMSDPLSETYEQCVPMLRECGHSIESKVVDIAEELRPEMVAALSGLPNQLIHRDLNVSNVLCSGGQVVGIVDLDHISFGTPVIDLAYFLHHSLFDLSGEGSEEIWLSFMQALLRGYCRLRKLRDQELAAIPFILLWIGVMFMKERDQRRRYLRLVEFASSQRHLIVDRAIECQSKVLSV